MKKNKAFTLIEILAVVTIIGLIFILVIPKITTSLKNKKSDVDKTTENLVLTATKLYVSDHSSKFEKTDGNISCMPLHQLVRKGYLDGPVKNVTDDKDITNGKSVRITYDKGFKYELINKKDCKVNYCKSDYCDDNGNGYTEVEYLESTGTQYIDTGVYVDYNTGFMMKIYPDSTASSNRQVYLGSWDNNNYYFGKGSAGNYNLIYRFFDNEYHYNYNFSEYLSEKEVYINKNFIKVNDNEASLSNNTITSTLTTYIFARHRSFGPDCWSTIKLYYMKIYDDDTLIRDYVPVIDSSNRPCLFDKVESKCYYNQGEGEFIVGYSDRFNQQYRSINYIESTGTQYIDTGVYPDYNTGFMMKIYPTKIQSPEPAQVYLGSYDGNNYYFGKGNRYDYNLYYQFFDSNYIYSYNSSDYSSEKEVYANKDYINVNGQEATVSSTTKSSSLTMYLFARHNSDGPALNALVKLYYLRIYDDNILVRDYIPVLDSSERPCLYDKLENKCYYNQGTGEFLWG